MPFRYDPQHWRDRAEDMRRLAHGTTNENAKQMMLRIAEDYDELASTTAKNSGLYPAGHGRRPEDHDGRR